MKKRKLTDPTLLIHAHPDLYETFYGPLSIHGNVIFYLRHQKGFTQEQLAELAKVEKKLIPSIEGGVNLIDQSVYSKVYRALGVSKKEVAKWILTFEAESLSIRNSQKECLEDEE
ncbi:helix-turn-helix domain-containing protein [Sporosarcina sp. SG10008]|uniref:helix-turn-helix domain-containing protein n=1 Tax=Sporosarcina sp. SG10008 TaxID=3373103 RepID=UPI0037DCF965